MDNNFAVKDRKALLYFGMKVLIFLLILVAGIIALVRVFVSFEYTGSMSTIWVGLVVCLVSFIFGIKNIIEAGIKAYRGETKVNWIGHAMIVGFGVAGMLYFLIISGYIDIDWFIAWCKQQVS